MHWLKERFELSRGHAHNDKAMEGLRGFAVFLVFLVHFSTLVRPFLSSSDLFLGVKDVLHAIGNTGVDLFFVLSGYLIYGSLMARVQAFPSFMARRIQRIYPTFIPVFLLYIALSFLFPAENKIPTPWTDGLAYLVQNFLLLPGLFPIEPMITVAWSLSYEMFYYLVIPLLIGVLGLRRRSRVLRCVFFVALASGFMAWCALYDGPARLVMFLAGVLLHEAMTSDKVAAPSSLTGFIALVAGVSSTLIPSWNASTIFLAYTIQFLAFLVVCLACFRRPSSSIAQAFGWTPLRWLGNMSYSYYLMHGLALKAGFLVLSLLLPGAAFGPWFFWVTLPILFGLSLVPSALLFVWVERPFSLVPHLKPSRPPAALQRPSNKGAAP